MRTMNEDGMAETAGRVDVPVDVFKCEVVVWVGDPARMVRELSREGFRFPEGYPNDNGALAGSTLGTVGEVDKVIWLKQMDIPALAHEAVHAAQMICEDKGIKDEEVLSYLVEHIVRTVLVNKETSKKEKRR